MRTKLVETNLPERYIHVVKNAETVNIPLGTPLVLNLSGTKQPSTDQNGKPAGFEDGLQVVLPATAGSPSCTDYRYGVALGQIAPSQYGESQLHGVVAYAIIAYATRGASTDSWTSSASIAASKYLSIDTINNAFTTLANTYALSATSAPVTTPPIAAQLIDSVASFAASASNTSDSRTALTALKRVFVRQM